MGSAKAGLLSHDEFQKLAQVPPEVEWFANIDNERTRRAYQMDLRDFMSLIGIRLPEEFRVVTRAHVIAWRKSLEQRVVSQEGTQGHGLSGTTIRRKLSAHSSLLEYLCERNAMTHNSVKGAKRPAVESYESKTPAIGDHQARELITDYLEAAGHGNKPSAPLFQAVKDNTSGKTSKAMTTDGIYWVVKAYARQIGLGELEGLAFIL